MKRSEEAHLTRAAASLFPFPTAVYPFPPSGGGFHAVLLIQHSPSSLCFSPGVQAHVSLRLLLSTAALPCHRRQGGSPSGCGGVHWLTSPHPSPTPHSVPGYCKHHSPPSRSAGPRCPMHRMVGSSLPFRKRICWHDTAGEAPVVCVMKRAAFFCLTVISRLCLKEQTRFTLLVLR